MPNPIKIRASAKINLCLDVLKKTPSCYHKIQTVFQEIPKIKDDITLEATKDFDKLSMIYGTQKLPPKSAIQLNENLAFKALLLIKKTFKIQKFANISIKKNIPLSSGLGGASSDAAAILKGLDKLWNLKLSQKKLLALAAKLGNDVPFFIIGGTALGTNFGEKVKPLPAIKNIKFKIFPRSGNSATKTKSAYASLDLSLCAKNVGKTKKLLAAIRQNNSEEILANIHNDFETLKEHKNILSGHHLSGSGPSTYLVQF